MDKYAVNDKDLVEGLRNEEHTIMIEISRSMSGHKTAEEEQKFSRLQSRLQEVRDKIMEHDLKR